MPAVPPPTVISLILCESLIQDADTQLTSFVNVLTHIHAGTFPVFVPRAFISAEVTNGRGPIDLALQIIDVDEAREPVAHVSGTFDMPDPLAVIQATAPLFEVAFPKPGEYRVQIRTKDHILLERRLLVLLANMPHQGSHSR